MAMFKQIEIVLNGASRTIPMDWTVEKLLRDLELSPGSLAVEINQQIVPREVWPSRPLEPGDHLEVVHFVGGG